MRGTEPHLLFLAWRYGGENPYRLHNGLDENYVPYGGGLPKPPPHPTRVRNFIFGCALFAQEQELALHDKKIQRARR